jgi:retron-type reverse transcriptase
MDSKGRQERKASPSNNPSSQRSSGYEGNAPGIDQIEFTPFDPASHGFRPNRGVHTMLANAMSWGPLLAIIQADYISCFDEINHELLIGKLTCTIDDKRILSLILDFLSTDIRDQEGKSYKNTEKGTRKPAIAHTNEYLSACRR